MHRGHWKEASGSAVPLDPPPPVTDAAAVESLIRLAVSKDEASGCESGRGRDGSVVVAPLPCGRFAALEMTALRTWVSVGGMPHARHGGICVCAFNDSGSKLDGTGFEKLQMGQTHVAAAAGGGPRRAVPLPPPSGDAVLLRAGMDPTPDDDRPCCDPRFAGLG